MLRFSQRVPGRRHQVAVYSRIADAERLWMHTHGLWPFRLHRIGHKL
jgi:hypothetical protein